MFVIKYDKVSMIRLVQCIEKHPAIYDTKNRYFKEEQDSAWDKVALEVGEKDSLCRDRWHSIKSCYIRHLKYSALNLRRRPYYLAEYMDFLLPHVIDRVKIFLASKNYQVDKLPAYLKEALPKKEPKSKISDLLGSTHNLDIKEEIVDVEEVSDSEWLNATPETISQPSSSKAVTKRLPSKRVTQTNPTKKIKTLKVDDPSKSKPAEDDDIKFFKSLMPEVARMSSHQKLKFKQEALSIIEDILYASEEVDSLNITD